MLSQTLVYKEIEKRVHNGQASSGWLEIVNSVETTAKKIMPQVEYLFKEFPDHGVEHAYKLIKYMGEIISDMQELSDLELVLILLAAFLHDVGMVVTEEEVEELKSGKLNLSQGIESVDYKNLTDAFFKYVQEANEAEKLACQYIFRRIHGTWCERNISRYFGKLTLEYRIMK